MAILREGSGLKLIDDFLGPIFVTLGFPFIMFKRYFIDHSDGLWNSMITSCVFGVIIFATLGLNSCSENYKEKKEYLDNYPPEHIIRYELGKLKEFDACDFVDVEGYGKIITNKFCDSTPYVEGGTIWVKVIGKYTFICFDGGRCHEHNDFNDSQLEQLIYERDMALAKENKNEQNCQPAQQ